MVSDKFLVYAVMSCIKNYVHNQGNLMLTSTNYWSQTKTKPNQTKTKNIAKTMISQKFQVIMDMFGIKKCIQAGTLNGDLKTIIRVKSKPNQTTNIAKTMVWKNLESRGHIWYQ